MKSRAIHKQAAVRIGDFTVLALPDEDAERQACERLQAAGYQTQTTAHFVVCRQHRSPRVFLLHRLGQKEIDADLLPLLNDELSPLGIIHSAREYSTLLFAILAAPFPAPREQRHIWRRFCLNTLARLHDLMASAPASSPPLQAGSHLAAFAAIYQRVSELAIGPRMLDVGCSFGFLPILLARQLPEGRVVGCDNNPDLLPIATDLAQVCGVSQVTFLLQDVLATTFSTLGRFETVTAIHLLEHLSEEEMRIALMHLFAVTTRRLMIAVPYEEQVQSLYGHQQIFTPDSLQQWGNWCVAKLDGAATSWCEEVMGGLLIVERGGEP